MVSSRFAQFFSGRVVAKKRWLLGDWQRPRKLRLVAGFAGRVGFVGKDQPKKKQSFCQNTATEVLEIIPSHPQWGRRVCVSLAGLPFFHCTFVFYRTFAPPSACRHSSWLSSRGASRLRFLGRLALSCPRKLARAPTQSSHSDLSFPSPYVKSLSHIRRLARISISSQESL